MAKKISKHSRAARRSEIEIGLEAKSLEQLPRAEKTDLANILIRTAARNEALLDAKILKKQDRKKHFKRQTTKKALESRLLNANNNSDKDRLEHALNLTNRLDGKISKSIARAKYIQNSRKANWDQTNEIIKRNLNILPSSNESNTADKEEINDDIEDEIEDEIYSSDNKKTKDDRKSENMFSLLSTDVED